MRNSVSKPSNVVAAANDIACALAYRMSGVRVTFTISNRAPLMNRKTLEPMKAVYPMRTVEWAITKRAPSEKVPVVRLIENPPIASDALRAMFIMYRPLPIAKLALVRKAPANSHERTLMELPSLIRSAWSRTRPKRNEAATKVRLTPSSGALSTLGFTRTED